MPKSLRDKWIEVHSRTDSWVIKQSLFGAACWMFGIISLPFLGDKIGLLVFAPGVLYIGYMVYRMSEDNRITEEFSKRSTPKEWLEAYNEAYGEKL